MDTQGGAKNFMYQSSPSFVFLDLHTRFVPTFALIAMALLGMFWLSFQDNLFDTSTVTTLFLLYILRRY